MANIGPVNVTARQTTVQGKDLTQIREKTDKTGKDVWDIITQ